jgi:hypothetical protein
MAPSFEAMEAALEKIVAGPNEIRESRMANPLRVNGHSHSVGEPAYYNPPVYSPEDRCWYIHHADGSLEYSNPPWLNDLRQIVEGHNGAV